MRSGCALCVFGLSALSVGAALAPKDVSRTPFQQWTQAQAVKLYNDSAWVQLQRFTIPAMGGSGGINEYEHSFVVRLFSARPIRESYIRILQLINKYDSLPADRKQAFDSTINGLGFLNDATVKDEVVVAVEYKTNDPDAARNLKRFFDTATTATLNQSAYLFTSAGRVDLKRYIPPGKEGLAMPRFIFPREVKGHPIVNAEEKEIRFDLWVSPIGQRLLVGFKCPKLIYNGGLAY